jgi:hypothetical protein
MSEKHTIRTMTDLLCAVAHVIHYLTFYMPKDAPFITEHNLLKRLSADDKESYQFTPETLRLVFGIAEKTHFLMCLRADPKSYDDPHKVAWAVQRGNEGHPSDWDAVFKDE